MHLGASVAVIVGAAGPWLVSPGGIVAGTELPTGGRAWLVVVGAVLGGLALQTPKPQALGGPRLWAMVSVASGGLAIFGALAGLGDLSDLRNGLRELDAFRTVDGLVVVGWGLWTALAGALVAAGASIVCAVSEIAPRLGRGDQRSRLGAASVAVASSVVLCGLFGPWKKLSFVASDGLTGYGVVAAVLAALLMVAAISGMRSTRLGTSRVVLGSVAVVAGALGVSGLALALSFDERDWSLAAGPWVTGTGGAMLSVGATFMAASIRRTGDHVVSSRQSASEL